YTPIVRAIKATNADIVFVASYPPDSVGMLRAAHEVGLQPKIFGGGMVALMFTTVMTSTGPMRNGMLNYDFWAPDPSILAIPGIDQFRGPGRKVVLYPDELKSGTIIYPYSAALK